MRKGSNHFAELCGIDLGLQPLATNYARGCGSKLNRRGKSQALVFGSIYQSSILVPVF